MLKSYNSATLLHTIKDKFPEISWKIYEVFNNGWDNQVILLDKKLVFRFPRNEYIKNLHQKERKLLDLTRKYVDLPIPQYTLLTDDDSCVGYKAIPGVPMTIDVYQSLGDATKEHIQTQIADFLTQLHSIPLDELASIGYIQKKGNSQHLKNNFLHTCASLLTKEEIDTGLNYINDLDTLECNHKVITHCDITQKNIFIDDKFTHITGIIDFSDAMIADPALDFGRFSEYGEEFMSGVYEKYKGPKESDFLNRAMFYNKRLSIFTLIHAIEEQEDIDENLTKFRTIFF